ncbi:MAG: pentapeptide repeat-containing protein [Alphaproteobacteria bacterium]
MNKPDVYEVKNKEGVVLYSTYARNFGQMIQEAVEKGKDLSGADLRNQDLSGLKLRGGKFDGADFEGADVQGAQLQGAKLKNANFTNADTRNAAFYGTDLESAKFCGAKMESSYFFFCHVKNADFTNIKTCDSNQNATLQDLELVGAKIDKDLSRGRMPLDPEKYYEESYESYKKAAIKVRQEIAAERKKEADAQARYAATIKAKGNSR